MIWYRRKSKTDRYKGNRRERRVQVAGIWFDSNDEAQLYLALLALQQAGEIREIKCQVYLKLTDAKFVMIPDFQVWHPDGSSEFHEMKGNIISEQFKRNTRLWRSGYGPFPGAKLTVWKMNKRGPYVWKVIVDPRPINEES